jgi:hypothetical protein
MCSGEERLVDEQIGSGMQGHPVFPGCPSLQVRGGVRVRRDMHRVGQKHVYIRCLHSIFGREITKLTVMHGVYTRL